MNDFDDQLAVVTGAAQGLGLAITMLLLERGARVAMLDLDEARLRDSAQALDAGDRVMWHCVDVTDEAAVIAAKDRIEQTSGVADLLVNNAGIYPHATLDEISVADWDHVFDVNVKSAFLMTRAFTDAMKPRGYGRVVNIVTVDAYKAKPTTPHYAASKAALGNLLKTFALELAPHGVLVNGVSPGAIATERAKSQSWLPLRIKEIPIGRAAEPEDIAEVVLFLGSKRNRFIVGETVIASGGAVML
ncbi:MAG: oxidoreductase [Thiotrichales bacterium]|nr:oxidoreductase [Thiotrichales bacterium]|tara:strand:+ start:292 stop:1029 length:738 start_codon:yes stop_codon:yes gene_type:complete